MWEFGIQSPGFFNEPCFSNDMQIWKERVPASALRGVCVRPALGISVHTQRLRGLPS